MFAPYIEEGRVKYRKAEQMALAVPQGLSFTQEQNDRKANLMNDIKTYTDEVTTQFMIGKKSLAEWDSYVKKVNEMGIQEVLDMYTKSYESYKNR